MWTGHRPLWRSVRLGRPAAPLKHNLREPGREAPDFSPGEYVTRCIYVLTVSSDINVARVYARHQNGGHDVPVEKIRSRYKKALALLPELINVCDVCHIYDNSGGAPVRIFKKRKTQFFYAESQLWIKQGIEELTNRCDLIPFP